MVGGARSAGLENDAGLLHNFVEREAARSFFAGAERGADERPIGRFFTGFGRLAVARCLEPVSTLQHLEHAGYGHRGHHGPAVQRLPFVASLPPRIRVRGKSTSVAKGL